MQNLQNSEQVISRVASQKILYRQIYDNFLQYSECATEIK
jgi:hypothetical protein